MSTSDVLAYLIERQQAEGISGMTMALRLGMSETNWSHARRGRRQLTSGQVERAIHYYPALRDFVAVSDPIEAVS